VSRNLWLAAAVIAVLAIVIVIALRPSDQSGTTIASPTPSAAASVSARPSASVTTTAPASAAPSASAGTSAVYNDDFGFLVLDVGISGTIRKESSNARIGSADGISFAISPDGRQVAYWTTGTNQQLRVFPAGDPSRQQTLVTLSTEHGVGVVWSHDGSGLAYSVSTGGGFGNVDSAAIRTRDLQGTTNNTVLTSTEPGKILQPIAWDRAASIVAAGVTGDGGFMMEYIVVSTATPQAAPKRSAVSGRMTMSSVHASSDAKLVLGVDLDSGAVKFWPLADLGANKTAFGTGKTGALWQPGTHKIGALIADNSFVLQSADDGSASTPFRGAKAGSFVRTFRADGTAVVLSFIPQSSTGLGSTDYTLYRLSDGANATFQDLGGLSVSVRLR
jgi:hypothetical protein